MREINALAEAVKKARYDLRLTQQDVQDRGGPSTATLRLIEQGVTADRIRSRTLLSLDAVFGWESGTAAALVEGREDAPSAETPLPDPTLAKAAEVAPSALGEFIGDGVAVVLLDHAHDEHPDPNIHELAHRVLMLARLGGGQ